MTKAETVRAYWDASAIGDYETAGGYVAEGFVWIDHTKEVVARTVDEHMAALEEDALWSDREFRIEHFMETDDGALVVQSTMAGTLTGMWRSVEATGQRVTHAACSIFRFNEDRLIVSEEMYADALTIMSQLGVLLPS